MAQTKRSNGASFNIVKFPNGLLTNAKARARRGVIMKINLKPEAEELTARAALLSLADALEGSAEYLSETGCVDPQPVIDSLLSYSVDIKEWLR